MQWENSVDNFGIRLYKIHINGSNVENVSENRLTLDIELSGRLHRWNVIAVDLAGNETQSPAWSFTVDRTSPSVPSKLSPRDNMMTSENVIKFEWIKSTDDASKIEHYEIWIDDYPDFSSPIRKT